MIKNKSQILKKFNIYRKHKIQSFDKIKDKERKKLERESISADTKELIKQRDREVAATYKDDYSECEGCAKMSVKEINKEER